MGLNLTRDLASVYTTVTRDIHYTKFHVLHVLTEAAPDDPQGGTIRLCTVLTGWKVTAPRNPQTGERQEHVQVACADQLPGRQYTQPAGQPAAPLLALMERASQFEVQDTRPGGISTRYGKAEGDPPPRTVTQVYRQQVVMSRTETTPWHDPVVP